MQIEAFPSWSVVEKRNHKYEFAEKIEPSCSIIYIENPSFNKEQSQKYAIENIARFYPKQTSIYIQEWNANHYLINIKYF